MYLNVKFHFCWVTLVPVSLEFFSYQPPKVSLVGELNLLSAQSKNGAIQRQYLTHHFTK